ncbi:plasmid mobilization relaxosome protein MobC [Pedobacter psychroterrae]|uniref:Plasmid mobilization relaxosome protein MobC n=1 Tax=Pedobacter psychroterrae TaxID=2530453 RepID=A0A4R0NQ27_9SPHI|nr:plasmid mobilization relaxosome protein MobC [Pedobacter psychroterrae]TCD03132.1 plasmid mobilization relaxosome protein MobC [Pedobacter psychroterrae]
MPRKKSPEPEKILTRVLRIRLTDAGFHRLEKISTSSDCRTIGEAARKILSKEKITLFYKDITLNSAMEELALIRKELRAIGININQITKAFHSDKRVPSQNIQVTKIIKLYETVEGKTDTLLLLINRLAEKWLPRS